MVNKCLINWPYAFIILAEEYKMSYNGMFLISFFFYFFYFLYLPFSPGNMGGLVVENNMPQYAVSHSEELELHLNFATQFH